MSRSIRNVSAALLIFALVFAGMTANPRALPQGQAQQVSVAGTVLGLAVIAGIIYLVSQDQQGVYHRYPYGRYSQGHYRYEGAYAARYRNYQNRFYGGPLPGQWSGDRGRMNWSDYHRGWTARCAPGPDSQGRFGQRREWDAWCQQNMRFRGAQPDQGWRRANPWDRGSPNDGPGH
jgi:hypothetical protein